MIDTMASLDHPTVRPARATVPLADLRLAAIDLDGTLLGPDLVISAANHAALAALQARGIMPVIASGRHHEAIVRFARQVPGLRWIVSAQGGEVADVARTTVLHRDFLVPADLDRVLAAGVESGVTAMVYATDGVLAVADGATDTAFYAGVSGQGPQRRRVADLPREVFKVVWSADAARITALRDNAAVRGLGLQLVQTHERFLELQPPGVSKASGLAHLATHLGLEPRQVVAFGDAENDISMFDWTGHSVAMPHGWPTALRHATRVGPAAPPEEAFARAVEALLAGR